MQVSMIFRVALLALCGLSASCGGGGGSSSSSSGGVPQVNQLFVATHPTGATASASFTTQPVVHVRSPGGVTLANDNSSVVTASIVSGTGAAGATLTGTTSVTVVAGVATFTNLGISTAGTNYQLQFSSTGIPSIQSSAFNVAAAPVVRTLAVTTQPVGAGAGVVLATQPSIQIRSNGIPDANDNTTAVTATLVASGCFANARLLGTATATANAGVVTFNNLAVNLAGGDYRLRFAASGTTGATSANFSVTPVGTPITPSVPPAGQVTLAIDSGQDACSISRFIYGLNDWNPAQRPANLALDRSGGNRMTAYNWETNASNAGADWFNQNDDFLGGGNTPNGAVGPAIEEARAAGAGIVVTMPTIGYVAADKNAGGDVNQTPNYLTTRFHQSPARKGSAFSLVPNTGDAFVYQDEYIHFLDQTYQGAFASTNTPIFISLDNEVDLWHATHARLRGDAVGQNGTNITYAEVVQRTRDYANAAKDVNPNVTIFGPVNYGWQGMVRLQGAADHANRDFLEFYLAQMAQAEVSDGRRVLDVLDVHWYPEAVGNNAAGSPTRITEDNTDAGVIAARKQAPRSLWDSSYVETSWITNCCSGGALRLIPRLRDKINTNYPNTRLAITEYNYGAGGHISGGIAQADALGIFGREGVFAANNWRLSGNNTYLYGAFEMFRNYDGANGSFGDISVRATNTDAAAASVYASVNAGESGRMVVVAINKNDAAQTAGISVTHTVRFNTAQVYTLTSASSQPLRQADIDITLINAFPYTMPANSVTTLVLLP
jgi:hypothetical protein